MANTNAQNTKVTYTSFPNDEGRGFIGIETTDGVTTWACVRKTARAAIDAAKKHAAREVRA
jgi:hypothetical protein